MGHAIVTGGARASAPATGIKAGDLAVGSSVYLMENGVAVEYLVVNQGIPSDSSLYDDSCDGTWLLRKELHSERQFGSNNTYASSNAHAWLNGDYIGLFDENTQAAIKQVKIPHLSKGGGTLSSGANGVSTKAFLLGGYEVGFTEAAYYGSIWEDGACLEYFSGCSPDGADAKRIGYLNGTATVWWLRTPYFDGTTYQWMVGTTGSYANTGVRNTEGVRPALILNSSARFDAESMILKG